jgi:hypothetical protein
MFYKLEFYNDMGHLMVDTYKYKNGKWLKTIHNPQTRKWLEYARNKFINQNIKNDGMVSYTLKKGCDNEKIVEENNNEEFDVIKLSFKRLV